MMTRNGKINSRMLTLGMVVFLTAASVALGAEKTVMANGMRVNLYGADEIAADPSLCGIRLAETDAKLVPFDEAQVLDALAAMHGFDIDLEVDVFVLPAPPAIVNSSYSAGNNIYLAPGTGLIAASTQAYIVTHEMGHVLTWAFLDDSTSRWNEYMELRGLTHEDNGPDAAHADRAREIVAEDFRYLFGGPLATASGSIENRELPLPDQVDGLVALMDGFLSERPLVQVTRYVATAFPNPCNPRTTVLMELPVGTTGQVRLSIYDVRGRLVRSIDGGAVQGDHAMLDWNGDDDQGSGVASGRYLYVMQAGGIQAQGSLTLVR